jgi:transposase
LSDAAALAELARLREENAALGAAVAVVAAERDALRARAEKAEHERNEFRKLYLLVTYELERLKRQLFGKKAETVDPAQVQLAFGPVLAALEKARGGGLAEVEAVETELGKLRERAQAEVARRKAEKKAPTPHGRRDLSLEDLPVEEIIIEPPERLIPGGEGLVPMGEEVSEHIDRRPASLVRVRVVRRKYKVPADAATAVVEATASAASATATALARREPLRPGSIIIGELP